MGRTGQNSLIAFGFGDVFFDLPDPPHWLW